MENDTILVATRSMELSKKVKNILENQSFNVIDICSSGSEALRKASIYSPSLILLDYNLGDMTGLSVAQVVLKDKSCFVILFTDQIQKDYAQKYFEYPYLICLLKPLNKSVLNSSVEISLRSRKSLLNLQLEIDKLKDDIESRKVIEKAKGILMNKLGINEEEAYKRLRRQSMDSQIPMKSVAKVIISTMK